MIKVSRSRLEIRQDPDKVAALAGLALAGFGALELLVNGGQIILANALNRPQPLLVPLARALLGMVFMASGWLFLRGRSRVVLDRDHHMVARYLGVGGRAPGGNRTWDLDEFGAVVLVSREQRRLLDGRSSRSFVVCMRRRDGEDLEIYWAPSADEGARVASRAANFARLPYFGREPV